MPSTIVSPRPCWSTVSQVAVPAVRAWGAAGAWGSRQVLPRKEGKCHTEPPELAHGVLGGYTRHPPRGLVVLLLVGMGGRWGSLSEHKGGMAEDEHQQRGERAGRQGQAPGPHQSRAKHGQHHCSPQQCGHTWHAAASQVVVALGSWAFFSSTLAAFFSSVLLAFHEAPMADRHIQDVRLPRRPGGLRNTRRPKGRAWWCSSSWAWEAAVAASVSTEGHGL